MQDAGPNAQHISGSSTAGHWLEQRPDSAIAQGQYAWPAWAIVAVGVLTVVAGSAYLLVRWRRLFLRR